MKKILFTLVALCATMSIEAQKIEIYDKGELVTTYYNEHGHEYKVVFKEIITGTAKRTGDIDVKWVRLWAGGPKFAEYNVGASEVGDYGGLYAWGGCQHKVDDHNTGTAALSGPTDTATILWGENWRMPTKDELVALKNNCTWEWTTQNGVNGLLCTGKEAYSSNSIFLPAAGWYSGGTTNDGTSGLYWSSTPSGSDKAYGRYFDSNSLGMLEDFRSEGYSVRAVLKEE